MGEARQRRKAIEAGPCPCGSTKPANACCYRDGVWRKPPATLGLRALPANGEVQRCYLRELGSCGGGISGEHLVSRGVVQELTRGGGFSVSGLPWLEAGETRILSPEGITAKCLCRTHNSTLSPLDSAAKHFFSTLSAAFDEETTQIRSMVSGHDLERWLLKTLRAFAVSKNLGVGREPLPGQLSVDATFVQLLDDPLTWLDGAGLYCTMRPGDLATNNPRFRLQPLSNDCGEIAMVAVEMMGLVCVLCLEPPANIKPHDAMYRPSELVIRHPNVTHFCLLSWEPSVRSGDAITMQYAGPAPRSPWT
jgi:hypothetical protein